MRAPPRSSNAVEGSENTLKALKEREKERDKELKERDMKSPYNKNNTEKPSRIPKSKSSRK